MKTVKDYNLPLNSLKQTTTRKNKHCAILPSSCRHCQSKAKHSRMWAQAMSFLTIKEVDLWPFDLESGVRVTWSTPVPIFVFLGLSVLELGPIYATDRQTDRRQTDRCQTKASLNNRSGTSAEPLRFGSSRPTEKYKDRSWSQSVLILFRDRRVHILCLHISRCVDMRDWANDHVTWLIT